jgi:hypothetical protein
MKRKITGEPRKEKSMDPFNSFSVCHSVLTRSRDQWKVAREKDPIDAPPAPKLPVVVIEQALIIPITPHIEYYAMLEVQDSKDYLGIHFF